MASETANICGGPALLDASEIAAFCGIGVRTFWRWVSTGIFPKAEIRIGAKVVKWRCSTVAAWIESRAEGHVQ